MIDAIPAATLVVFRESAGHPPELLMVERAKAMAFAGGALVFPGGRIDPGDHALAATLPDASDDAAGRIAAIRETLEEAGLAIGLTPLPDATRLAQWRARLHAGAPFGEALAEAGATLDLAALEPFARWCPAHAHARVFDTRFFLARLPSESVAATVDGTENIRLLWTTPRAVLDAADRGEATLIFPTRRNLERLATFASFDAAVVDARRHSIRTITPWVARRDGVDQLCIPDDLGYPVTAEPLTAALRG